jgi:uncharacterized protein YndB with AHSA1/START domain
MKDRSLPVEVSIHIQEPVSLVWDVMTEIEPIREWFFENIPNFEAKVGSVTRFAVSSEERTFSHIWKVLEVVPQNKLVVEWRYDEYDGASTATYLLDPEDGGTRVTIIAKGLDQFPADIPEFAWESCEAGWKYFGERLRLYCESD